MEEDLRGFEDGPLTEGHDAPWSLQEELWCAALWEQGEVSGTPTKRRR